MDLCMYLDKGRFQASLAASRDRCRDKYQPRCSMHWLGLGWVLGMEYLQIQVCD